MRRRRCGFNSTTGRRRSKTEVIDIRESCRRHATAIMLNSSAKPLAAALRLCDPDRWWSVWAAYGVRHPGTDIAYPSDGPGPLRTTLRRRGCEGKNRGVTQGYADKTEFFVDRLSRGLARIAAASWPKPVIVRMSDFKTNEYAGLIGGAEFEPHEENPMIGFRGAARYYSPRYREGFGLECRAIHRLRNEMGFTNVIVMIPFCRSTREADLVLSEMADNGLRRGDNDLQVFVMCEVPSNVVLAEEFAKRFDGFSIGSNDLTQLTLGVDRDSDELAGLFDEQDPAVKWMIANVIREARAAGAKIGLCGQAPSDHPEFAAFLVECGIDSISVTPDSFIAVKRQVAAAESIKELIREKRECGACESRVDIMTESGTTIRPDTKQSNMHPPDESINGVSGLRWSTAPADSLGSLRKGDLLHSARKSATAKCADCAGWKCGWNHRFWRGNNAASTRFAG